MNKKFVARILQLDAESLDAELTQILTTNLHSIISPFPNILDFINKYENEYTALLAYLINRFSLYTSNSTYGLELSNLEYRNERSYSGDCKFYLLIFN